MGKSRQLSKSLSTTIPLTENHLNGYPHLLLYRNGKLIPPKTIHGCFAGSGYKSSAEQSPPYYPTGLRKSEMEGTVIMQFVVDEKGNVKDPEAVRSTHPLFEKSCIQAIPRWRFTPGTLNGKPVLTRVRIPIPFRIN